MRKIAWDVLEVKFVTGRLNCLFVALIVLVFTRETKPVSGAPADFDVAEKAVRV